MRLALFEYWCDELLRFGFSGATLREKTAPSAHASTRRSRGQSNTHLPHASSLTAAKRIVLDVLEGRKSLGHELRTRAVLISPRSRHLRRTNAEQTAHLVELGGTLLLVLDASRGKGCGLRSRAMVYKSAQVSTPRRSSDGSSDVLREVQIRLSRRTFSLGWIASAASEASEGKERESGIEERARERGNHSRRALR